MHSFPDVLEHDQDPEEVHAYHRSVCSKNRSRRPWKLVNSSDELTLTQAQKLSFKWQLWLEAIIGKIAHTSVVVTDEVLEPIEWKDVPHEKQSKIFNPFILLKRERDQLKIQFGEITKDKARLVMDGSRAQTGVDVYVCSTMH